MWVSDISANVQGVANCILTNFPAIIDIIDLLFCIKPSMTTKSFTELRHC